MRGQIDLGREGGREEGRVSWSVEMRKQEKEMMWKPTLRAQGGGRI